MASTLPTPTDCCSCESQVPSTCLIDDYISDQVASLVTGQTTVSVSYETFAAIRALTSHSNNEMIYLHANGTFNGHYVYNSSSTAADDGFNTLKPDNVGAGNPGRWIRE